MYINQVHGKEPSIQVRTCLGFSGSRMWREHELSYFRFQVIRPEPHFFYNLRTDECSGFRDKVLI